MIDDSMAKVLLTEAYIRLALLEDRYLDTSVLDRGIDVNISRAKLEVARAIRKLEAAENAQLELEGTR